MPKFKIFFIGFFCASLLLTLFCYLEARKVLATEVSSWTNPVKADCAVVLTGSKGRIQKGIDLLWQKRVRKVIISGVYSKSRLRDIFPQLPHYVGVSKDDIILEKRSLSTFGNAMQSLPLTQALKCRDIILVTSRLHMRRAYKIFKKTFPEEIMIHPYATISGHYKARFWPTLVEVLKSLFYSIWAY